MTTMSILLMAEVASSSPDMHTKELYQLAQTLLVADTMMQGCIDTTMEQK